MASERPHPRLGLRDQFDRQDRSADLNPPAAKGSAQPPASPEPKAWEAVQPIIETANLYHFERRLVERLQTAIEESHFQLYVQTIAPIGAAGNGVAHHEVLLRLLDEDGAILAPVAFLPTAERHGLMPEIDLWVVEHALDWWATHYPRLAAPGRLSINLAAASVGNDRFGQYLIESVDRSNAAPETLIFEITESEAIRNLQRTRRLIGALRDRGCRVALDDFGSGYASFRYLKELPIDYLKTDGLFMRDLVDDSVDLALVRSMNCLGHEIGAETVAEWVETPEILSRVRALGIDYAQGFEIDRPAPIERLLAA